MTIKSIKRLRRPETGSPKDMLDDIIKEINESTSSREDRIKRLQERLDLSREIAERLADESEGL